ncbi:hypothetical protein [Rhodopirellula bahusiensis]
MMVQEQAAGGQKKMSTDGTSNEELNSQPDSANKPMVSSETVDRQNLSSHLTEQGEHYVVTMLGMSTAYAQALDSEFLPSVESVIDWRHSITFLQQALLPLSRVIDQAATENRDATELWEANRLAKVKRELAKAFRLLGGVGDSVDELQAGSDALGNVVNEFVVWKRDASAAFLSREVGPPIDHPLLNADKVTRIREIYFEKLKDVIPREGVTTKQSELKDQCMASRKMYLVAFFVACVQPQCWGTDEFDRFDQLHGRLLGVMRGPSHYRASVRARRELVDHNRLLNPCLAKADQTSQASAI